MGAFGRPIVAASRKVGHAARLVGRNADDSLVRNRNVVKGSYYRGGICGKILGEVIEGRMLFEWNWADSSGRGVAFQEGDKLTATSGLNENIEGSTITLFLQKDS